MARNRFQKDYQLIETADEKGRIRTTFRYRGPAYTFEGQPHQVAVLKKRLPVLTAVSWIFWLAGMGWVSHAMHFLPAAIAYAMCAVPMAVLVECVFSFRRMQGPLESRHADRMNNRYPAAGAFLIVCSILALSGGAVSWIRSGMLLPGDGLFLVCAAALFLTGVYAFRCRKQIRIRKEKS